MKFFYRLTSEPQEGREESGSHHADATVTCLAAAKEVGRPR